MAATYVQLNTNGAGSPREREESRSESRSPRLKKNGKLNKIEEYAQMAARMRSFQIPVSNENLNRQMKKTCEVVPFLKPPVETHALHEVHPRIHTDEAFIRSYDVRCSVAHFAPQRAIDIGIWAEGSGFKIKEKDGWYQLERVVKVRRFLRGNGLWQTITAIAVMSALFLPHVFVWLQSPDNSLQDILLSGALAIFCIEFLGLVVTDAAYPFSFWFWMDLIATLSMSCDISYLYGRSATIPQPWTRKTGHVLSAKVMGRLMRFTARAGRLSRTLKIMKYFPLLRGNQATDVDDVKMARVISNQLNEYLATRVAFVTIALATILPMFTKFSYPMEDNGLHAWAKALSSDAADFSKAAHLYHHDESDAHKSLMKNAEKVLLGELKRFATFYSHENYGPFNACIGRVVNSVFECHAHRDLLTTGMASVFQEPMRNESIILVQQGDLQIEFNMAQPKILQAIADCLLICVIICVMTCFAIILSYSVGAIALQPLDRMLSAVRERCAQIFKFTSNLQNQHGQHHQGKPEKEHTDEDDEDARKMDGEPEENEFVLLEKAISKLAAIADLSSKSNEPTVTGAETEEDILMLNFGGIALDSQVDKAPEDLKKKRLSMHSNSRSGLMRSASRLNFSEGQEETDNAIQGDDSEGGEERPKLLGDLRAKINAKILKSTKDWHFDAQTCSNDDSILLCAYLLLSSDASFEWAKQNIEYNRLKKFITACSSKYNPNPFHNWQHAVDVTWSTYRFCHLVDTDGFILGDVAQFWLMVAALGHDMGHEGLTNQFLVETSHKLALVYNDTSPLENMHCASLFQILADNESNVFSNISKAVYKEIRKGMVSAILHTDITKHNEMVKDISIFYQMNAELIDSQEVEEVANLMSQPKNNELIVSMLLHTADVGNPMKPWALCESLAALVMQEFFEQGDKEKKLGIPVGMVNDRDRVTMPNTQIGFIEFMIAPMAEAVVHVFPPLDALAVNLADNVMHWFEMWKEEIIPTEDAIQKQKVRVERVGSKMHAVCRRFVS